VTVKAADQTAAAENEAAEKDYAKRSSPVEAKQAASDKAATDNAAADNAVVEMNAVEAYGTLGGHSKEQEAWELLELERLQFLILKTCKHHEHDLHMMYSQQLRDLEIAREARLDLL